MPAPQNDALLDGYRLIRVIGSGGFGTVWLCTAETLGQHFALKIIAADRTRLLDRELAAVQRFKQLAFRFPDPGCKRSKNPHQLPP